MTPNLASSSRTRTDAPRSLVGRIVDDIRSADPRVAKGGIQSACEYCETRRPLAHTTAKFVKALSWQLGSEDPLVRRWAYKLIAVLRSEFHLGYLEAQLAAHEPVAENRTWAVAAMAGIDADYMRTLYKIGDQRTLAYDLASAMYGRTGVGAAASLRAAGVDEPLAHQWLGLLYGDNRIDLPKSFLRELTASADPAVVEYTIWGLRKRRTFGAGIVAIDPLSLASQPVNVRRWYYRLVSQDPVARNYLEAQVVNWIENETDSKALEGLARGLHESDRDRQWRDIYEQWRRSETDPYVLRALGRRVSAEQLAGAQSRRDGHGPALLDVNVSLPFGQADPAALARAVDIATRTRFSNRLADRGLSPAAAGDADDSQRLRGAQVGPGGRRPSAAGGGLHQRSSRDDLAEPYFEQRELIIVTNTNNTFTFHGSTVGAVLGSGTQVNSGVHQGSDAAALLEALRAALTPDDLDALGDDTTAELKALSREAHEAGGTPDASHSSFWRRLRALTSVMRQSGAAVGAGSDLLDNLEHVAHQVPNILG